MEVREEIKECGKKFKKSQMPNFFIILGEENFLTDMKKSRFTNRVSGVNWIWFCINHQELGDNKKRNLSQKSLQSFRKIGTKCLERQKNYTNTAIIKPVPAALCSI